MDVYRVIEMVGLPDPTMFKDIGGKTALDYFNERVGFEVSIGLGPDRNREINSPDGSDHETYELVRAWRDLLRSINTDVEQAKEGGSTSNTEEHERDDPTVAADEGQSDDEFFDAVEC